MLFSTYLVFLHFFPSHLVYPPPHPRPFFLRSLTHFSTLHLNLNNHNNSTPPSTSNHNLPAPTHHPVVNLSDHPLTQAQLSVLSKGLQFCPTPGEPDLGTLRDDLDHYHTQLRRRAFFMSQDFPDSQDPPAPTHQTPTHNGPFSHPKFRLPSSWNPPGSTVLEAYITANKQAVDALIPRAPHSHNLSREQTLAITQLKHLTNITIKPADKGSCVVILNTIDYITEAHRQLNDTESYQLLKSDPTISHTKEANKIVDQMFHKGEIDNKCRNYLYTHEPRTPQLYLLPKIHKGKNPPPGRPIVSGNGGPTEKVSKLVDFFLKPFVPLIKSYVKDTTHFVSIIASLGPAPSGCLLCTLDVTSLYTNIPQNEGIQAVARLLLTKRNRYCCPSNTSLIQLLSLGLKRNNFAFNGTHYLQIKGTAMGNPFAPSFANIFMAQYEKTVVYTYHLQPLVWVRFIDDIFLIWQHGASELDTFVQYLNSSHPSIKFTSQHSTERIPFLDTTVISTQTGFITDLYTKPTDSHSYLLFSSAHPRHVLNSLPYSQYLRIRRICTRIEDFDHHALEMTHNFLQRGYPIDILTDAAIRARKQDRTNLLHTQTRTGPSQQGSEDKTYLITTHNPTFSSKLRTSVEANKALLLSSNNTLQLGKIQTIFGFRRNPNLRDILVHSTINYHPDGTPERHNTGTTNVCTTRKCRYCPKLDTTGRITCPTTGRSYTSMINISCKSNNLIYCITCLTCSKQYVGQTKRRLMDRFQSHFYNITHKRTMEPLGLHFNQPDHHGTDDLRISILQFVKLAPASLSGATSRDRLERKWIHRLHSVAPKGLNTQE